MFGGKEKDGKRRHIQVQKLRDKGLGDTFSLFLVCVGERGRKEILIDKIKVGFLFFLSMMFIWVERGRI